MGIVFGLVLYAIGFDSKVQQSKADFKISKSETCIFCNIWIKTLNFLGNSNHPVLLHLMSTYYQRTFYNSLQLKYWYNLSTDRKQRLACCATKYTINNLATRAKTILYFLAYSRYSKLPSITPKLRLLQRGTLWQQHRKLYVFEPSCLGCSPPCSPSSTSPAVWAKDA